MKDGVPMPVKHAHSNLSDRALADACIGNDVALLIGLEFLYSMQLWLKFLTLSFVDTSIGTGGNESKDGVLVGDSWFSSVTLGAIVAHRILRKRHSSSMFFEHRQEMESPIYSSSNSPELTSLWTPTRKRRTSA